MKLAPPASRATWTQEGCVTCYKPHSKGTGHVVQLVSTCLGSTKPWVSFLVPNKLGSTGWLCLVEISHQALGSCHPYTRPSVWTDRLCLRGQTVCVYKVRPSASTGSDRLRLQGQTVCIYRVRLSVSTESDCLRLQGQTVCVYGLRTNPQTSPVSPATPDSSRCAD